MADYPMIFSAPMVLALLDGRKTQARRVLKEQRHVATPAMVGGRSQWQGFSGAKLGDVVLRYAPGDRLWVKEAWRTQPANDHLRPSELDPATATVWFDASSDWQYDYEKPRYRHARFMPRWASRLTLTVTDVRVQRVQDISEEDAVAEGIERLVGSKGPNHFSRQICGKWSGSFNAPTAQDVYADIWNTLHGPDAWDRNPWVAAYTFTVHNGNIDGGKA
ncbi:MAG: hypothetical protein ACK5PF_09385 [bacterium]|jgi:hypothetical protein